MAKNSSNSSTEVLGNTKPKPPQQSPSIRWCFTLNMKNKNETEALEFHSSYSSKIKPFCKYFIYKLEKGKEEQVFHLQGYLELLEKTRQTGMKKIDERAHWEPAQASRLANIAYCSKLETKVSEPIIWDKSKEPKYTADQLMLVPFNDFKKWQKEAIEKAKEPVNKRHIYWYWSSQGGMGKTEVAKHLIYYHNWGYLDGDKQSIMCSVLGEDGEKEIKAGYVFNFGRNKDMKKVSYSAMENLKDGLLFSSKYKSNGGLFPPAKIIVMANEPPHMDGLSEDRWIIINVDNKPNEVIKTERFKKIKSKRKLNKKNNKEDNKEDWELSLSSEDEGIVEFA